MGDGEGMPGPGVSLSLRGCAVVFIDDSRDADFLLRLAFFALRCVFVVVAELFPEVDWLALVALPEVPVRSEVSAA